jgi:GTP-binding protein
LNKPRWLVLNKTDLLSAEELEQKKQEIIEALDWKGPVYTMSALGKTGTQEIVYDIMNHLDYGHEAHNESTND